MDLRLKVPPAVLLVVAMILIAGGRGFLPEIAIASMVRCLMGAALIAAGIGLAVSGVWAFRCMKTTLSPTQPHKASALVQNGIYRRTRNPMYSGLSLALLGWSLLWNNWSGLIWVPLFTLYLTQFQIKPEEEALSEKWGQPYAVYCQRVRRWI